MRWGRHSCLPVVSPADRNVCPTKKDQSIAGWKPAPQLTSTRANLESYSGVARGVCAGRCSACGRGAAIWYFTGFELPGPSDEPAVKHVVNPVNGKKPVAPAPPKVLTPGVVGQIRFAEDADFKKGDFWLEQTFELGGEAKRDGKDILKLFAGMDEKTQRGLSVTLRGWEAVLEAADGNGAVVRELKRSKLPNFPPGEYDLGMLWRRGELSVWVGPVEILAFKPEEHAAEIEALKLDSAVQVLDEGVKLGARRALAFNAIRFDDNFMRDKANDDWKPASGLWELTSMAFAERSANPFSLRASFTGKKPFEDEIYGGNKRTRQEEYGLGVQLSMQEGTPHIVRITGGSPAAHAGLAEDDIFIEVNGNKIEPGDAGCCTGSCIMARAI